MPAGPAVGGFLYFAGVKVAGYTIAVPFIKRVYDSNASKPSTLSVGLTRTAIGVGVGITYGGLWALLREKLHIPDALNAGIFMAVLVPIRFVEWKALVKIFFDRTLSKQRELWKVQLGGTIWSYCLDGIGILAAFVLPGGMWIC